MSQRLKDNGDPPEPKAEVEQKLDSTFAPSGCFGGQDGGQVGSRSEAEAWLFGSCAPRIRGAGCLIETLGHRGIEWVGLGSMPTGAMYTSKRGPTPSPCSPSPTRKRDEPVFLGGGVDPMESISTVHSTARLRTYALVKL
jgi:hypothetical protein